MVVAVIAGAAKTRPPDLVSHPLLKGLGEGLLAISHGVVRRCCCCGDDDYGGCGGGDAPASLLLQAAYAVSQSPGWCPLVWRAATLPKAQWQVTRAPPAILQMPRHVQPPMTAAPMMRSMGQVQQVVAAYSSEAAASP